MHAYDRYTVHNYTVWFGDLKMFSTAHTYNTEVHVVNDCKHKIMNVDSC